MGFYVHRSNRAELLADALCDVLAEPQSDPFAREVVAIPSRGLERWVSMELAQRLGVCAHVDFPFPARFLADRFDEVLDVGEVSERWRPDHLIFSVLGQVPRHLDDPAFAPLAAYLDGEPYGRKAWQLAQRIAGVFDRYITYRRDMLRAWDTPEQQDPWQPRLWRALRESMAAPHLGDAARAFVARLKAPAPLDLPARLCLFGLSTLPPFYLELLRALGERSEVHLFVLQPSNRWFADTRPAKQALAAAASLGIDDPALVHVEQGHPLLASLGRIGREFQDALTELDALDSEHFVAPAEDSLLHRLQADVMHLRHRGRDPDTPRVQVPVSDTSITLHACHGPMRQVEVLRDQLRSLFESDPTLQPRDVVVMCPDVEGFAPLVRAAFDPVASDPDAPPGPAPAGAIPYRIADRSLRKDNGVAEVLLRVMDLVGGRVTANEVHDLLCMEPVCARFEILVDELDAVARWVRDSGVRWGLDAEHRAAHGQPAEAQNTWRFGLDRLLLGYAAPAQGAALFAGVLPYDEIEGGDARLLGRFADFVEALTHTLQTLTGPVPIAAWCERLAEAADRLIDAKGDALFDHQAVRGVLKGLAERADAAGFEAPVPREVARNMIEGAFAEPAGSSGLSSGGVTFCALVPMRSIPFRVVALLGMDDAAFPRAEHRLGFDLMRSRRRPGDRSPRDDDRYLFLEAVLAARDRLLVLYTGWKNNKAIAPAVPVGELFDVLEEGFLPEDGRLLVRQLRTRHPLQPFSPVLYGGPDRDPVRRLQSWDARWLDGAKAVQGLHRVAAPPLLRRPLPELPGVERAVTLGDLMKFLESPVRWLLRRRLGLRFDEDELLLDDREPSQLSGVARWEVGNELLRLILDEGVIETRPLLQARGLLPAGAPGQLVHDDERARAVAIAEAVVARRRGGRLEDVVVNVDFDGTRFSGQVSDRFVGGQVMHRFGHLRARHVLRLWVRHLAMCLVAPGPSTLVGRPRQGGAVSVLVLRAVQPQQATAVLVALTRLYWEGLQQPRLFFPETSRAWYRRVAQEFDKARRSEPDASIDDPRFQHNAGFNAAGAWDPFHADGESSDPYHQRFFGGAAPYDRDYHLPGELELPPNRTFHRLAMDLWGSVDRLVAEGQL